MSTGSQPSMRSSPAAIVHTCGLQNYAPTKGPLAFLTRANTPKCNCAVTAAATASIGSPSSAQIAIRSVAGTFPKRPIVLPSAPKQATSASAAVSSTQSKSPSIELTDIDVMFRPPVQSAPDASRTDQLRQHNTVPVSGLSLPESPSPLPPSSASDVDTRLSISPAPLPSGPSAFALRRLGPSSSAPTILSPWSAQHPFRTAASSFLPLTPSSSSSSSSSNSSSAASVSVASASAGPPSPSFRCLRSSQSASSLEVQSRAAQWLKRDRVSASAPLVLSPPHSPTAGGVPLITSPTVGSSAATAQGSHLRSILKRRSVTSITATTSTAAASAASSSRRAWSPPASLFASSTSASTAAATAATESTISSLALVRTQQLRDNCVRVQFCSDVAGGEANTDIVLSVFFGDIGSRVTSCAATDSTHDGVASSRAQLSDRFYDWTEANALASLPVTSEGSAATDVFSLLDKDQLAIAHFKLGFDGLSVSPLSLSSATSPVSDASSSVPPAASPPSPTTTPSLVARIGEWNLQCHRTAAAYVRDLATFVAAQRDAAIAQKRKLVVDSGRLTADDAAALSLLAAGATANVRVNAFGVGAGALSAAEFVRSLGAGERAIGAHEVDLSTVCANLCILDPAVVANAKSRADADALMALPRPPSVEPLAAATSPPSSSCFDFGCFSSSATTDMGVSTRRDSTGDAANVFASTAAAPSAAHARTVPPPDLSRCLVLRRVLCLLPGDAATTLPSVHPTRHGRTRTSQSKPSLSPSSSSASLLGAVGAGAVEDTVLPVFPAAELCSVTEDVLPGSRADAVTLPALCKEAGDAICEISGAPASVEDAGVLGCQMAYFAIRHFFVANGTLLDAAAMTAELPASFTEDALLAALNAHTSQSDFRSSGESNAAVDVATVAAAAAGTQTTPSAKTAPTDRIGTTGAFDHSTTRLVHSATAAGTPLRVRVISRALTAAPSTAAETTASANAAVAPVPKSNTEAEERDELDNEDSGATRLFLNKFHRFLDFKIRVRQSGVPDERTPEYLLRIERDQAT